MGFPGLKGCIWNSVHWGVSHYPYCPALATLGGLPQPILPNTRYTGRSPTTNTAQPSLHTLGGGCPTTNTAQHSLHWAVSHYQYCPALATYIGGCPTTHTAQHSLHWAVSHYQYCPALATYIGGGGGGLPLPILPSPRYIHWGGGGVPLPILPNTRYTGRSPTTNTAQPYNSP